MENGARKYIETIEYLGNLYAYFNSRLFNGELFTPVITVQRDEKNRVDGWWSLSKVWHEGKEDEGEHELNITAQALNKPITEIAGILIHEMCHQYATANNMQDCSRGGAYHNKLFKRIAETHGLKVENVSRIGYAHTELNKESKKLVQEYVEHNPEEIIYRAPVFKGQTVRNTSTRKYMCGICGSSVRATKAVNIMCMDCNEPMACEE